MKPYEAQRLPLDCIDWAAHVTLIGRANAALARYDGMLQSIVNPAVLLSPLTTREAVLSSRIEGTQATLGEVLEFEAGEQEPLDPSRRTDIHRDPQLPPGHGTSHQRPGDAALFPESAQAVPRDTAG